MTTYFLTQRDDCINMETREASSSKPGSYRLRRDRKYIGHLLDGQVIPEMRNGFIQEMIMRQESGSGFTLNNLDRGGLGLQLAERRGGFVRS